MSREKAITVQVVQANALDYEADVLVLKFAQHLYGVDAAAWTRLADAPSEADLPQPGRYTLLGTSGSLGARQVLFIGVPGLRQFGYEEIRVFGEQALSALVEQACPARHIAFTVHGVGYGLDEVEAFRSELLGIADAVESGVVPQSLQAISFVEFDERRASRLSAALRRFLPEASFAIRAKRRIGSDDPATHALRLTGPPSAEKAHVFVAMPFASEMDDVFYYGIQGAVNASGLLCERADSAAFTGDVIDWVRRRIETARLVIADLSTANANVYLEVGYAWGHNVPTVLLAKDSSDLKFDVKGQRCIIYKSIRHLEESLTQELKSLLAH